MPNHISNVLTITGKQSDLTELINIVKAKGEERPLSFESFLPMPKEENDWYNWNIQNWGTKWDAYEVSNWYSDSAGTLNISFQTAWSTPFPALLKLSSLVPNVQILCEFADEDTGFNVGEYTLKNGSVLEENIPEFGTPEAINIAQNIYQKADNLYHHDYKF